MPKDSEDEPLVRDLTLYSELYTSRCFIALLSRDVCIKTDEIVNYMRLYAAATIPPFPP
jgi:hypothetical protein